MTTLKAIAAGLLMTAGAVLMIPIGVATIFRTRRLYAWLATQLARSVLRIYGVSVKVVGDPFPLTQTVYVSNHTSTLDLFVLVALGLPNTRFFLSGFVRKFIPLGIVATMMGTFFTVPQDRPEARRRIFMRATAILRRTRESVYLSPEGGRIVTGEIGHFNKGAFHLATVLQVPIVPMYFEIPRAIDPGRGYAARAGTVTVHVLGPIDTAGWKEADLLTNRDRVRDLFVAVHKEKRCASMTPAAAA